MTGHRHPAFSTRKRFTDEQLLEHQRAYYKAYDAARREQRRLASRARYWADPCRARAESQTWKSENPDMVKSSKKACNMRRRKNGKVTASDVRMLKLEYSDVCCYCLVRRPTHIEHVTPISRGGVNDISNLVMACSGCNLSKGSSTVLEFLVKWPRLRPAV